MSYYIEVPENKNKANQLERLYKAERLSQMPSSLSELPLDTALVCVVENPNFDAALYCYNDDELAYIGQPDSTEEEIKAESKKYAEMGTPYFNLSQGVGQRPRTWLLMDKSLVQRLTGCQK